MRQAFRGHTGGGRKGAGNKKGGTTEGFLSARFQEFYLEFLALGEQITGSGDWLFTADPLATADHLASPDTAPVDGGISPNAVWQRLITLLERQALTAQGHGGDLAATIYSQAQYLMAALADEILLNLEWAGRETWKTQLLEAHLFKTHSAGEVIFERLDEMLASPDPIYLEIARLYLTALALGFQGQFRDSEHGDLKLASYRQRLLLFIHHQEATLLRGEESLFPDAYTSTLDHGISRELPYLRRWVLFSLVLLGLWVFASVGVWWELTGDLRPILERIIRDAPVKETAF